MAYMLPLRYIRVGPDVSICATKIICMMSTKCYQARQTLKAQRESRTLINACGKMKAKTAIFMDNGVVISSPLTVQRLQTAIEKSNAKDQNFTPGGSKRLKVYDIMDPQPDSSQSQVQQMEVIDYEEEQDEEEIESDEASSAEQI